jgi:DNA-binding protein H-NS
MRGKTVPPKYRGPDGETWAGRGATPRWLTALLKEGHSIDEFLIGAGRKKRSAAAKKPAPKKKGAKPARKPRQRRVGETASETAAAG